jgi:integrase
MTTNHPTERTYSMARDRLKAVQIQRMTEPGRYHDGGGLYLQISPTGTKSWVFRFRLHGKLRDMGLGSVPDFSLAEARARAQQQRQLVSDKIDPVEQRNTRSAEARRKQATEVSFEDCARDYHEREKGQWKNEKHRAQWLNTLAAYVFPLIGGRKLHTLTKEDVVRVLKPIWQEKPETASRVKQRIRAVLDWAAAADLHPGYEHGMWTSVSKLLGTQLVDPDSHHAAAPYAEVGSIIAAAKSSKSSDIVKLAFEFTVLTAARSGETRGAHWTEFDEDGKLWIIPAGRMKAGKEHRVPLTERCLAILKEARQITGRTTLAFCNPATKTDAGQQKPFSDAVFTSLLHKGLEVAYTMHGFRSSFRDWGGEQTNHARELLEISLAHLPGDQTEQAYWRKDRLEKRRQLMEDWAQYAGVRHKAHQTVQKQVKTRKSASTKDRATQSAHK